MKIMILSNINRKYIKQNEKVYVAGIFLIVWIGLLLQHLCIGMYFDDFGNAALAYGYVVDGVQGTNFTVGDILEWAKWIFLNWGGRIFYACVILIPLLKNGITIYMGIQSVIIIVILYLMYKMVCIYVKKESSIGIAVTLIIMYGLIDYGMHVHGTYWASASILYIWPLVPMFISLLIYDKICRKIKNGYSINKSLLIIEIISIALTTLSQEQYGVALIVYYLVYIGLHHIKELKKFWKIDAIFLIWSVITYMFMFCAPGNFVRMDTNDTFSNLSFVEKLVNNMPIILDMYLNRSLRIFNILTVLATVLMSLFIMKKNNKSIINRLLSLTTIIIVSMMFFILKMNVQEQLQRLICFAFLLNTALLSLRYFGLREKAEFTAIVVMAAASTFCLLMSPSVMHRSFLCYIFCVAIIVSAVFWENFYELSWNNKFDVIIGTTCICSILLFGLKSFNNTKEIFFGYYENKYAIDYNEAKLRNLDITSDNEIILLKYPNDKYRSLMPWDNGFDYIEYWMKEYYDIPQEIKFRWVSDKNFDNYISLSDMGLQLIFGNGTYELEEENDIQWHWCENEGEFIINNPLNKQLDVQLKIEVYTATEESAQFILQCGDTEQKSFEINKDVTHLSYNLKLLPGNNVIHFSTDARKIDLSEKNDLREIYCGVKNGKIIIN